MNGIHDMGGMDGFGKVVPEAREPVFHADWERRMFAVAAAVPFAVAFADDHLRREIERIAPVDYLKANYYELWYRAIVSLLEERGVFSGQSSPKYTALAAADVPAAIRAGASTRKPEDNVVARFTPGMTVQARNMHPKGHTRLPRYARGKLGRVVRNHGVFSFADSYAHGLGHAAQHLYAVSFTARELWGPDANAQDTVILDLWDAYLEPTP